MTIPFHPSIYEHAARVIDRSPWDVSRDGDLLAAAHIRAWQLYQHRPIVIGIDIYNLEAEAYGAPVEQPSSNGIPAIVRHPFTCAAELAELPPFDPYSAGRIPMVLAAARRVAAQCPGADVRIPLAGPFSVATNLMGFDNILLECATDPDAVGRALHGLVGGQLRFCRAILDAGLDIAFFESAAAPPLLSPTQFRAIELPALKSLMDQAAALTGHPLPCIIGGDTLPILEAMLATGTGYVCCPVATDQPGFMRAMAARPDVTVRINMDPNPITANDWPAVKQEADRVLALAAMHPKTCIGTGCLPYEADPETVLKTRHYIAGAAF